MSFNILLSLLPLLAASSPLVSRAGGPAGVPIPADCPTSNTLPGPNGYMPSAAFSAANQLYSAYYQGFGSQSSQAQECFEQCYGYGNPGECKAGFLAQDVPVPAGYYGSEGGNPATACLLFSAPLASTDYVAAPAGQYLNASAANIDCARSASS